MKTIIILFAASIIFSSMNAFADGQSVNMATVTNVREVFRTIIIREPISTKEEICEDESGFGGAILGGVAGGIIGNQFGRGSGNAAMTALGAVAGAMTGQNMARGTKCYPRDRISYVEREKDVIDGYIVTVESGEEFRTKTRYHVGDRVRIRSTIE
ncbi:MAG: glycine zipper 2TM domain-containing protein [Geobacteraceae bacterium]|nr:glycine zipper 2TM domain-containing protein [Geobacteraceae bacterium]NTW80650.1 glycine zipper 2TM domain-containing protein [Geobacteraceae bacterium]